MMDFTIRPMAEADRTEMIRILRNTPEFTPDEVEVAVELIDTYLEQGEASGYKIRVAQAGFVPIGYICYGPAPLTRGTWDMYWIAVDAVRQGEGIGRALMEAAEAEIKKAEGRLVLVETSSQPGYEKTRKFYHSLNYDLIATIPDFYSLGDNKLILGKKF